MLLISADDFGRRPLATDSAVTCFKRGTITSASAMVFMKDSRRAANLARDLGIDMGLHLNFTQKHDLSSGDRLFSTHHDRIVRYLSSGKLPLFLYNPLLRRAFDYVFNKQFEEFLRISGRPPTHIDGHHHAHLCANMIIGKVIPPYQIVRRNFTFYPGEKSLLNRTYRTLVDGILKRRYWIVDLLFSLSERLTLGGLSKQLDLATNHHVELQSHPESEVEFRWLSGDTGVQMVGSLKKGDFTQLKNALIAEGRDQT